jgi:MFS transporter, FHS family, L-fucose permease
VTDIVDAANLNGTIGAVKGIFTLSNVEAQLSAFAFFIAYAAISFPSAELMRRLGPLRAIILALATMIAGGIIMLIAANIARYPAVLFGLCILPSGIARLQVAANTLDPTRGRFAPKHRPW